MAAVSGDLRCERILCSPELAVHRRFWVLCAPRCESYLWRRMVRTYGKPFVTKCTPLTRRRKQATRRRVGTASTRHVDVWERRRRMGTTSTYGNDVDVWERRRRMATCGVHSTETATLGGRIKTSTSGSSLLGTGTSTFGVARRIVDVTSAHLSIQVSTSLINWHC